MKVDHLVQATFRAVAVHEAGHAVAALHLRNLSTVPVAGIEMSVDSDGHVSGAAIIDEAGADARDRLVIALAGCVADSIVGTPGDDTTRGDERDEQRIKDIMATLPPGLAEYIFHEASSTAERLIRQHKHLVFQIADALGRAQPDADGTRLLRGDTILDLKAGRPLR